MEVLPPTAPHTHTIILLHPRHSTASSFRADFFESESSSGLTLPEIFPSIKWIFPSASPTYSRQHNQPTSQWFDMSSTSRPHHRAEQNDMITNFTRLSKLISREAKLIGPANLFLAGVQQGAAIGIHTLLAQNHRLGGFIAIGSWFPNRSRTLSYFLGQSQNFPQLSTPALIFHNTDDDEIDLKYGRELHSTLRDIGMRSTFHSYETGGNWLNEPEGVDTLVRWLSKRMALPQTLTSFPEPEDYFSCGTQRDVALLAKRIHENMPEERKRELLAACRKCGEEAGRRLSCDPVEMYCMSRAQRQLGSCKGMTGEGKMQLMCAS